MRIFAALFSILAFAGCFSSECVNTIHEELSSPDGTKRIVLFSRDCGATIGPNIQATVLDRGEKLPNSSGNLFIIDKGTAKASWKKDGGILVVFDSGARVFKKEITLQGIAVEYREN